MSFGTRLKAFREAAGFTQEELATIAGLSVHAVSALERGERRRPHLETVRALSAALDLVGPDRDGFLVSARALERDAAADELIRNWLPVPPTTLVGRDAEIERLRRWLADPGARLVTLTGPGGVGKTRLALHMAGLVATDGLSRVLFVPLASVRSPELVGAAIAEALGLSDVTARDLARRVRTACGGRQTLVVLDNCEQVLEAATLVAELLASVPPLRFLATSREPLHVRGERDCSIGPLAFDTTIDSSSPADLARAPAVRLFLERVRDVRPDFQLTPVNGPAVAAICRRLDALPLALELAAPWLKVLTPEELGRRIGDDRLLAGPGSRDLPERQQTMNAAVAWSYQLLGVADQRAFRRLGALPGRFPVEAAAAVLSDREDAPMASGDVLHVLAGLIDRSLLARGESSVPARPLYRMLETVRAYAARELSASGERDAALDGLARAHLAEAARSAGELTGRGQVEWLNRVRDDLDTYRDVLAWLLERGRIAEASDVAWALMFFWMIRGFVAEGLRWYERILEAPALPPAAETQALVGAGALWYTQGELEPARTRLARAVDLAEKSGAHDMIAHAAAVFGHVEYAGGDLTAARAQFARAAAEFHARANPWGTGNALTGLAGVALAGGDLTGAERLLDEAASVLHGGGPWFISLMLYVRAILAVRRGRVDDALRSVRESLLRIRQLHDKFAFVYALVPLAAAAVLVGDDVWAARIVGARDAVTERTGAAVADRSVQDIREQSERNVRARLGEEQWSRAYTAGRLTSIDSLVTDIDHALKGLQDAQG